MELQISLLDALLAFGIATLGATLQGCIGFGIGLLGVPLLVLIDPVFIPGPLLLAALLLTLLIAHRELRSIDVEGIKWAIPGRILGTIVGASLLTIIPQKQVSLLFGSMVLLAVLISIVGLKLPITKLNLFGAGTISGFMGTTASIGGAPMAIVYQNQRGPRIRGTLSSIFVFGTIISLISLALIGRFGLREISVAVILLPGTIIGFFLSRRIVKILDKGFIRSTILISSVISGIIVILRNII